MDSITQWALLAGLLLCAGCGCMGMWIARRIGLRTTGFLAGGLGLAIAIGLFVAPAPTNHSYTPEQFVALKAQGLYPVEKDDARQPFVWTRGNAALTFDTLIRKPVTLTMELRSATVAGGADTTVHVLANGVTIGIVHPEPRNLRPQSFSFTFIPPPTNREQLRISVETPTFSPAKSDPRQLGTQITRISLNTSVAWQSVTKWRWLLGAIIGGLALALGAAWVARRTLHALVGFVAIALCGVAFACTLLLCVVVVRVGSVDRFFYGAWLLGCISLGLLCIAVAMTLPFGAAGAPSLAARLQTRWEQRTPRQQKSVSIAGIVMLFILAAIPILHIATIVATTGANTLSEDFGYEIPLVDQILSGTYGWQHYIHDTFIHQHLYAVPLFVDINLLRWTHWNVYIALTAGFVLSLIRLVLLHRALTDGTNDPARWFLWPLLAALVFSTSQINPFTISFYGGNGNSTQIVLCAFALGIWALVRFPNRWRGVILMAASGAIAALSGGLGVITWPVFLLGLLLLGYRKIAYYLVLLVTAALSTFPYTYYLILRPSPSTSSDFQTGSLLNLRFIVEAIGYPFAENFSLRAAAIAGTIGIALAISGLLLLWRMRGTPAWRQSIPALLLIAFGLVHIWQLSVLRSLLAPWYPSGFMSFWIGLLGLAYVLWVNRTMSPHPRPSYGAARQAGEGSLRAGYANSPSRHPSPACGGGAGVGAISRPSRLLPTKVTRVATPLWSVAFLALLTPLYLSSNLTYEDKVNHLYNRGPTAASCVRHYQIAPPYCIPYVQPYGGRSVATTLDRFAGPLDRHGLSVFAPHQRWTLQGDFIFDTVRVRQTPDTPAVRWTEDQALDPLPWWHYKHLNLLLYAPNSITWSLTLPANLTAADFHSAIALSTVATTSDGADGVTFHLFLTPEGKEKTAVFNRHVAAGSHAWQPFTVPLSAYAGQTITLELASDGGANTAQDWAMYRYPYIDLQIDPHTPVNPEVRDPHFIPMPTSDDLQFDLRDGRQWTTRNMQRTPDAWIVGNNPLFTYTQPLNLCLGAYSHLSMQVAASPDLYPRTLTVFYGLDGDDPTQVIKIPLFEDGDVHLYTYDLKLLDPSGTAHLTSIKITPVLRANEEGQSRVQITDVRLIRRPGLSACGSGP